MARGRAIWSAETDGSGTGAAGFGDGLGRLPHPARRGRPSGARPLTVGEELQRAIELRILVRVAVLRPGDHFVGLHAVGRDRVVLGVNHQSVVSRSPPPFGNSFQTWTVFLPERRRRRAGDRARAATISEADAEPPSTRTTTGMSLDWSRPSLYAPLVDLLAELDGEQQLAGR